MAWWLSLTFWGQTGHILERDWLYLANLSTVCTVLKSESVLYF